ncbi:MAG: nucleotidyltransferase family protein [Terracidiphilus sp.]
MSVAAIILAAGASRRLGQPKQLLEYFGETLLERALRIAKEAGAAPALAVLGAHFAPICATIPFDDAIPVLNDHWEQGLSSSIQAGLNEVDVRAPQATGALIMSCDQPRLTSAHLRALLGTFAAQATPSIVASSYSGVQGIPAVFPRATFSVLRALRGDKGARSLLGQAPCPVIALPFDGGEFDIDFPADLAELE